MTFSVWVEPTTVELRKLSALMVAVAWIGMAVVYSEWLREQGDLPDGA